MSHRILFFRANGDSVADAIGLSTGREALGFAAGGSCVTSCNGGIHATGRGSGVSVL